VIYIYLVPNMSKQVIGQTNTIGSGADVLGAAGIVTGYGLEDQTGSEAHLAS
jgi:hypothetical protein